MKKTPQQCKTYREMNSWLDSNAQFDRQQGSHLIYKGPKGSITSVDHTGDIPKGTKGKILRMIVAAGIAWAFVVSILPALLH